MPLDNTPARKRHRCHEFARYKPGDDALIVEARRLGFTFGEIGGLVGGHSAVAIRLRIDRIEERAADAAEGARRAARVRQRPCMTCSTVFPSEGFHHRMCDPCREAPSADANAPW